jgi:hypothetical protein
MANISDAERKRRSERAKKLRAEGKFLPKNPGRKRKSDAEIFRDRMLAIIRNPDATDRQVIDARIALERGLKKRGDGPKDRDEHRREFTSLRKAERVDRLRATAERLRDHWNATARRLGTRMLALLDEHGGDVAAIEDDPEFESLAGAIDRHRRRLIPST